MCFASYVCRKAGQWSVVRLKLRHQRSVNIRGCWCLPPSGVLEGLARRSRPEGCSLDTSWTLLDPFVHRVGKKLSDGGTQQKNQHTVNELLALWPVAQVVLQGVLSPRVRPARRDGGLINGPGGISLFGHDVICGSMLLRDVHCPKGGMVDDDFFVLGRGVGVGESRSRFSEMEVQEETRRSGGASQSFFVFGQNHSSPGSSTSSSC